jgi:hypothetical protein
MTMVCSPIESHTIMKFRPYITERIATTIVMLFSSASIVTSGESAKPVISECRSVAKAFKDSVQGKPIKIVLGMLSREVSSSPACACELIKTAIASYRPTPQEVAIMVDVAINAAPERIEEIVNCSIAAAPDSKSGILSTASDYGFTPNPLDFPGVIGEHPGEPFIFVPFVPIVVNPPMITRVDP